MGGKGPLCEEEEESECLDRHVGSRCIRKMDGPAGGKVKMMEYCRLLRLEGVEREGEEESERTALHGTGKVIRAHHKKAFAVGQGPVLL